MRIAIVDAHPDADPARLCHALAEAYGDGARAGGHEVRLVRVAELEVPFLRSQGEWNDSPVPPPLAEAQRTIGWAEHVVFIYPLWLGSMPALLKAFLEQVLRPGFAIAPAAAGMWGKLMKGRSARVVVTMGMPAFIYRWFFLAHSLRSFERNILKFCGFGPVRSTVLGGVASGNSTKCLKWLDEIRALGRAGR